MADEEFSKPYRYPEIHLLAISIIGALICYAVTIVAARVLSENGFHNYVVAVAVIGIGSSLGEAGVGKYALKALPAYRTRKQWSLHKGYWQFGLFVSGIFSLALALGLIVIELTIGSRPGNWTALLIAGLGLPLIAYSGVAVDYVMANRAAMSGMIISRIVIPGATIAAFLCVGLLRKPATGLAGILCFEFGSLVGLALCGIVFFRSLPKESLMATAERKPWHWLHRCISFAGFSILATMLIRAGVIVFEFTSVSEHDVAYLSAAIDTGCLVLMVSKSTDKFFQPQLSEILETQNFRMGRMIRTRRHLFVGTGCLLFLCMIAFFGKEILGLYGASFTVAYPGLFWIAVGTCLWTQFSLAPAYLNFVGMTRWVVSATAIAVIMLILLTAILGAAFGVNGACSAFGIVVGSLALIFFFRARAHASDWFDGAENDVLV